MFKKKKCYYLLIFLSIIINITHSSNDEYYSIVPYQFYEKLDTKEIELTAMYSFIFESIKFSNEYCEYAFQNCLLDSSNNNDVKSYYKKEIKLISSNCLPLLKSRYCLHSRNFANSDCPFGMINEKAKYYSNLLRKNLEACMVKYEFGDAETRNYSSNLSSLSKLSSLYHYILFIFFLFCQILKCYL